MPDWIVALLMVVMYALGFADATGLWNPHKPFWRGWWEGRTLAFLCRRRPSDLQ